MHNRLTFVLVVVVLSVGLADGQTSPPKLLKGKKHKAPAKTAQVQPEPAPAVTAPPPPPPTPEQGPSSPPDVSFRAGQLQITARNSTMSDVLNAVKQKTGAAVEMPTVSSERVVGIFGPGAPRDVIAQLLNGSHYDYVLLGSPADPGALKRIVLMARASGPQQAGAKGQPQQGAQNQGFRPPGSEENPNLQAVPEVENEQEQPEDNSADVQTEPQPEDQAQPDQPQPDQPGQSGQPTVKTPEQLLRELQQQQQQQQQDVPQGAPGQPPQ